MLSIGRSQVSPPGHIFWLPALIGSRHAARAHHFFSHLLCKVIHANILTSFPYRLWRVWEIDNSQTDENYSSERVLPGGAPQLPNDEFSRLGAGHRSRYEED